MKHRWIFLWMEIELYLQKMTKPLFWKEHATRELNFCIVLHVKRYEIKTLIYFQANDDAKISFPKVFVHVNVKEWINEGRITSMIQNVWNRRSSVSKFLCCLLVWDMLKPHLSYDVKRRLATIRTDFAIIPE